MHYFISLAENIVHANVSIVERVGTDGLKTVSIYTSSGSIYASKNVNISYTCGNDGYIEDSGIRSVVGLIIIVVALALAVFAMVPAVRESVIDYAR